jgi:hypothetical protein
MRDVFFFILYNGNRSIEFKSIFKIKLLFFIFINIHRKTPTLEKYR